MEIKPFVLEPRYFVFKRKHLTAEEDSLLQSVVDLVDANNTKPDKALPSCVVVQDTAPFYAETLANLEAQYLADQTEPAPQGEDKYVWGFDDEAYETRNIVDTLDEAIAAATAAVVDEEVFYVARVSPYTASDFFPSYDEIIHAMEDKAANSDAGKWAANSGWLDNVTPEDLLTLQREVRAAMANFFRKRPQYEVNNKFFLIYGAEEYDVHFPEV